MLRVLPAVESVGLPVHGPDALSMQEESDGPEAAKVKVQNLYTLGQIVQGDTEAVKPWSGGAGMGVGEQRI